MLEQAMDGTRLIVVSSLVAMLSGLTPQCALSQSTAPSFAPDSTLVLPGAANVSRESRYSGILRYDVPDRFPAARTLAALSDTFSKTGWVASDENLFGLRAPGAGLREWALIEIGTGTMYIWNGSWKDKFGNVVHINLQNQVLYIPDSPQGGPMRFAEVLRVEAIRLSAEMADTMRRASKNR
jgi:hypothetical protein